MLRCEQLKFASERSTAPTDDRLTIGLSLLYYCILVLISRKIIVLFQLCQQSLQQFIIGILQKEIQEILIHNLQKMHKKQAQFKRTLRKAHINQIKANLRTKLLNSFAEQQQRDQCTNAVQSCISTNDINTMFELFLSSQKEILQKISERGVIETYIYLSQNLKSIKHLLLLQNLINIHFTPIFSAPALTSQNEQLIEQIYKFTDSLILKIKHEDIDENAAISLGLNSYLSILKHFYVRINNKLQNYAYSPSLNKTVYIEQFIIKWIPYLLTNNNFLIILAKITSQEQFQSIYSEQLSIFQKTPELIFTLITNIHHAQHQNSSLSYTILTNIIKIIDINQYYAKIILKEVIGIVFKFYQELSRKTNGLIHTYLIKSFEILYKLLHVIISSKRQINSDSEILNPDFFQMIFTLIAVESEKTKQKLYQVLQLSTQFLLNSNSYILNYLNNSSLNQITMDMLYETNPSILSSTVRLLLKIIRSSQSNSQHYQMIMNYLYNQQIEVALETLQFHKNREISLYASELLQNEFKPQEYFNQDPTDPWQPREHY